TIPELYRCLWDETWDIIFFAGHSRTLERQGILYLNSQDRLTIQQLKNGFKQAISSGLQLAIFNSCDGLGLAEELGKLSLPQSIVMRLPIPDKMAQQFVKRFLRAYAGGDSLYLAMRRAREQLESYEQDFPCASWLPIIYQNPAVIPPQWSDFFRPKFIDKFKNNSSKQSLNALALIAILATAIALTAQFWGLLQPGELHAYDRLMLFGYSPPLDPKVVVVTVDDSDLNYQRELNMELSMRGSLADAALDRLVQKLNRTQVKAIGLDIIHDFPFDSQLAETLAQTDNFVAICRVENPPELVSIAPPNQLNPEQLGFSNWAIDNDGSIRRQIIGMSPDQVCSSSWSLSLRLALKYLGDVPTELNAQSPLAIDGTIFPQLQTLSGGYRLPEAKGYQILLNYRRPIPQSVTLREILTMPQGELELLVNNKIVLIGVVGHNRDLHYTPYSRGEQSKRFAGVMIHALMSSQIIDVVSGEQKLLSWASSSLEILWIAFWSAIGTVIIFSFRRSPMKIMLAIILALAILFFSCWLLLINGIWLIAIAPAISLILAATLTLIYSKKYSTEN
ncbi:MAG: CHASE2 domain-containing protein, partial [Cyanobacteria bacterium J06600_6]